jgi:hypothetical protein
MTLTLLAAFALGWIAKDIHGRIVRLINRSAR